MNVLVEMFNGQTREASREVVDSGAVDSDYRSAIEILLALENVDKVMITTKAGSLIRISKSADDPIVIQ